jgi:phosphinothricin acetyltransferase
MPPAVRDAAEPHLPAIAAIYAKAAAETPATFDLEGPPVEWWAGVLADRDPEKGTELLVAIEDEQVLGFAKSGDFKTRGAYATTRETSLYVHADHRGRGFGGALYTELLSRLDRSGLRLAVAGATLPNPASMALHAKHGFTEVGTFDDVGEKFGRTWSVRWFQRPLAGAGAGRP